MKKSIIFILAFILVFISLYFYVKTQKVSVDSYSTISIKYLPIDTINNKIGNLYLFNLEDSFVNILSGNLEKPTIRKLNFYDENFYQYIIKSVNKSKEIDISTLDSTVFNITVVDTLQKKHFFYLKQENVNQLINNYFSDLE